MIFIYKFLFYMKKIKNISLRFVVIIKALLYAVKLLFICLIVMVFVLPLLQHIIIK